MKTLSNILETEELIALKYNIEKSNKVIKKHLSYLEGIRNVSNIDQASLWLNMDINILKNTIKYLNEKLRDKLDNIYNTNIYDFYFLEDKIVINVDNISSYEEINLKQ